MSKEININKIMLILKKDVINYKVPVIDLIKIHTNNKFKVLIATILSARTKDETTAKSAERLFEKIKTFKDLKLISETELQNLIYPVGFYKTKAKNLNKLAKIMIEKYNNKIPNEINELIKLPGVGRKTANLVRAIAFNKPAICVDTHVHRIFNRLGYLDTKTPHETEINLRLKLPKKYWLIVNRIFVAFGQNTCRPISPFCSKCVISRYCNKIDVNKSR